MIQEDLVAEVRVGVYRARRCCIRLLWPHFSQNNAGE